MSVIEQYQQVFIEQLKVDAAQLPGLTYQSVPAWDSVGHMVLMTALEVAFDIAMDMDDIIDFSSFEKGKEILRKYNVAI
jgi:acyl carrier protein